MSNNRIEKVNSLLEREISKIIFRDFAYSPDVLVTLTRVDTTANFIEAKVFISVFPDDKADEMIKMLDKNIFDIQQKVNKTMKMRPVPRIKFVKDKVLSRAGKIEELLYKVKNENKD